MINNTQIDSTGRLGIIVQIGYPPNQFKWRHDPLRSGFVQVSVMQKNKNKETNCIRRKGRASDNGFTMVIIKLYYLNREINYL